MEHNQKDFLEDNGYLVIKNFFSSEEIKNLRELCLSGKFENNESVINGDIITHKDFSDIIFSSKLIVLLKILQGSELFYICDGTARGDDRALSKSARKFHTDSRADDFNFNNSYPLYRLGIYLQDTDKCSGGLKIRPKSHKRLCIDHGTFLNGLYRFYKYMRKYKRFPPIDLSSGWNVETSKGDLVIWNMRLHHSGHAIRLKYFPRLSLYPFIENVIPESWTIPKSDKRCVVFFAFGSWGEYLKDYFYYVKEHPDNVLHWQQSNFDNMSLKEYLKSLDVKLIYGNPKVISEESQNIYKNKKFF